MGAKGQFSTFFMDLKYDPSHACVKPYKPYGTDRYAMESYIQQGKRYFACLQDAAKNDMEYADAVVKDGYEKSVEDFISEIKRQY